MARLKYAPTQISRGAVMMIRFAKTVKATVSQFRVFPQLFSRSQSYDRKLQRQRCKFLQRHG
jgi:hypothetical protein